LYIIRKMGFSGGSDEILKGLFAGMPWARAVNLSSGDVKEMGLMKAEDVRYMPSSSSHGRSSSAKRKGRKARKEYYRLKGEREGEKEAERRRVWEERHPDGRESNWLWREERRKTRKAAAKKRRATSKR